MKVQIHEIIPQSAWLSWTAAFAGLASALTTWVPIIVGILSGIWISLQIWLFFRNRPWRK